MVTPFSIFYWTANYLGFLFDFLHFFLAPIAFAVLHLPHISSDLRCNLLIPFPLFLLGHPNLCFSQLFNFLLAALITLELLFSIIHLDWHCFILFSSQQIFTDLFLFLFRQSLWPVSSVDWFCGFLLLQLGPNRLNVRFYWPGWPMLLQALLVFRVKAFPIVGWDILDKLRENFFFVNFHVDELLGLLWVQLILLNGLNHLVDASSSALSLIVQNFTRHNSV